MFTRMGTNHYFSGGWFDQIEFFASSAYSTIATGWCHKAAQSVLAHVLCNGKDLGTNETNVWMINEEAMYMGSDTYHHLKWYVRISYGKSMAADSCNIGDDGGYICSKYFQTSRASMVMMLSMWNPWWGWTSPRDTWSLLTWQVKHWKHWYLVLLLNWMLTAPTSPYVLSSHLSDSPDLPEVVQASNSENANAALPQICQASHSQNITDNRQVLVPRENFHTCEDLHCFFFTWQFEESCSNTKSICKAISILLDPLLNRARVLLK